VSKEKLITQTAFCDCFSRGLHEGSKGCCEEEKISAEILVVEKVLCPITALLLPAVEEEVIATSEASYV
jgi:hypothetical protein